MTFNCLRMAVCEPHSPQLDAIAHVMPTCRCSLVDQANCKAPDLHMRVIHVGQKTQHAIHKNCMLDG